MSHKCRRTRATSAKAQPGTVSKFALSQDVTRRCDDAVVRTSISLGTNLDEHWGPTDEEWLELKHLCAHLLALGRTGGGKTSEVLNPIVHQSLSIQALFRDRSGLAEELKIPGLVTIVIDGKPDSTLFYPVAEGCEYHRLPFRVVSLGHFYFTLACNFWQMPIIQRMPLNDVIGVILKSCGLVSLSKQDEKYYTGQNKRLLRRIMQRLHRVDSWIDFLPYLAASGRRAMKDKGRPLGLLESELEQTKDMATTLEDFAAAGPVHNATPTWPCPIRGKEIVANQVDIEKLLTTGASSVLYVMVGNDPTINYFYVNLLIGFLRASAKQLKAEGHKTNRVLFVIDEFDRTLGSSERALDFMKQARSDEMGAIVTCHNLSDFDDRAARSLYSMVHTLIVNSTIDLPTLELLQRLGGEQMEFPESWGHTTNSVGEESVTFSMREQDAQRFGDNDLLHFMAQSNVAVLYRKDKPFATPVLMPYVFDQAAFERHNQPIIIEKSRGAFIPNEILRNAQPESAAASDPDAQTFSEDELAEIFESRKRASRAKGSPKDGNGEP